MKHQLIKFTYSKDISNERFLELLNELIDKEESLDVHNYCTCNGFIACINLKSSLRKAKTTRVLANYFPGLKKITRHSDCECMR